MSLGPRTAAGPQRRCGVRGKGSGPGSLMRKEPLGGAFPDGQEGTGAPEGESSLPGLRGAARTRKVDRRASWLKQAPGLAPVACPAAPGETAGRRGISATSSEAAGQGVPGQADPGGHAAVASQLCLLRSPQSPSCVEQQDGPGPIWACGSPGTLGPIQPNVPFHGVEGVGARGPRARPGLLAAP